MQDYIMQALQGDHEAFSKVYDHYADAALRLSVSITRSSALAEDAVQEAFLRIFKKGYQYRHSEKFEPWFFRIIINESKRAVKRYPNEMKLDESQSIPSFTNQSDLSATIASLMDKLSEEHRLILSLRFLLDYSERSISEIIQKPLGTVKSRIHYAKKALREIMKGEEEIQ